MICGSGGARHFRSLLAKEGKNEWPELISPYVVDTESPGGPSPSPLPKNNAAREKSKKPDWGNDLQLVCLILLLILPPREKKNPENSPLLRISMELARDVFSPSTMKGVNKIAGAFLKTRGLQSVNDLILALEKETKKTIRRPNWDRLDAARKDLEIDCSPGWRLF